MLRNSTDASVKSVMRFSMLIETALLREEPDAMRHHGGLRHRLDQEHTGCDRPAGEVSSVERGVGQEAMGCDDVLVVDFENLVDEAKWLALRDRIEQGRVGELRAEQHFTHGETSRSWLA